MSLVRCKVCLGVYATISPDGVPYQHVCPPVLAAKVQRPDGSIVIVPRAKDYAPDVLLEDVALLRAGARNENPDLTRKQKDGSYPIVSGGGGVDELAPVEVPIVGVLNAVRAGPDSAPGR